jgi:hypothetical protein
MRRPSEAHWHWGPFSWLRIGHVWAFDVGPVGVYGIGWRIGFRRVGVEPPAPLPGDYEFVDYRSDLEIALGLTDSQYRMILSADQNGFLPLHRGEEQDVEHLVAEGLMRWKGEGRHTAENTPRMTAILEARQRQWVESQQGGQS